MWWAYIRVGLYSGGGGLIVGGLRYACHCTIMPLLASEIPAKLSSSQLSRPTADVTVALEAVGEQMFTCSYHRHRRRHICEPGLNRIII
jgi:hypothetical protein